MPRLNFIIEPELEKILRKRFKRKGEISKTINEALRRYFAESDPETNG